MLSYSKPLQLDKKQYFKAKYAIKDYEIASASKALQVDKRQLFTANYAITDYEKASDLIIEKARTNTSFGVSALAVHGLIETVKDPSFRDSVNQIDLVVPDGQPVKWALNSFYKVAMKDRVAGPQLTLCTLQKANKHKLKVYLYGSTSLTLEKFQDFIRRNYPSIIIAGTHADRFREATPEEDEQDIKKINASGANIVLVGRGCPRQEKWVAGHQGKVNAVMMAVGAAFDFHAVNIKHAPTWMQNSGLEWFFRLIQDPKRLWKRYLFTNSHFVLLFILCKLDFHKVAFK
jgi:exopolysaccharide biosynthesis WecB/TagA/CpsF family protein